MNMRLILAVPCSLLILFPLSAVAAPLTYFAWSPSGIQFVAANRGVNAVVDHQTDRDDLFYLNTLAMTNPTFVAAYGASVPALKFDSGASGSAGNTNAYVSFSSPLPAGSRLLIFDVDIEGRNERIFLSSREQHSLLEQLETRPGANSSFPQWTPSTGRLLATSSRPNDEEASVFDVGGVSAMTISYRRDSGGGGPTGASFAFAIPVPEPASLTLVAAASLAAALISRRSAPSA
jgi:Tol biopolymer transport system component